MLTIPNEMTPVQIERGIAVLTSFQPWPANRQDPRQW
jgi:hypothetical protein